MPPEVGSISRTMQRATVDLPEPLSPTMPSVRPLRKVRVTFVGGGDLARFAEQRALAIDLAELVGFQHDRLRGLRRAARAARGSAPMTSRLRVYSIAGARRMVSSEPVSTSLPLRITATRSAISATTPMSWVMNSTAVP